jgi:hypothetical protein
VILTSVILSRVDCNSIQSIHSIQGGTIPSPLSCDPPSPRETLPPVHGRLSDQEIFPTLGHSTKGGTITVSYSKRTNIETHQHCTDCASVCLTHQTHLPPAPSPAFTSSQRPPALSKQRHNPRTAQIFSQSYPPGPPPLITPHDSPYQAAFLTLLSLRYRTRSPPLDCHVSPAKWNH